MTDIYSQIETFTSECWTNIFVDVRDAVVYMDHCAIECLHWHTAGKAYLTLKDAGAIAVHEIDKYRFRYAEVKAARKAVIVSTSSDPTFYRRTLKMILAKNIFESCSLYCGAPCSSNIDPCETSLPDEKLDYTKLKKDIKLWMKSDNISGEPRVDIIYTPIFMAFLNKNLFVTPSFGNLMPPLNGQLSEEILAELNLLAYSFCQLFDHINARLDVYSIGSASEHLTTLLESYTTSIDRGNRIPETSEIGVSLILLDRTLDLAAPTSSSAESFLTKVLRTSARLPHHRNDVAIDLSPLFGSIEGTLQECKVYGSLAALDETAMNLLISQEEKQLLIIANQFLNDMALSKESPKLRTPSRISGHSLEKILNRIKNENSIDPRSVAPEKLQFILAIIQASTSRKASQLNLLRNLESLALESLSVRRESSPIFLQLANVIRTRNHRGLDTESLLALLIHIYAAAGTEIRFSAQQERQLEESIRDAVFEDIEIINEKPFTGTESAYRRVLQLSEGKDVDAARDESRRIAAHILDTLGSIALQRSTLQDYRFCMQKPNSKEISRYVGVLEQIGRDIFCAELGRELRDLRKKVPSFISAGFNLILRGKAKRRPRDNPFVLIYVVGGITMEEAKIIQEVTSTRDTDTAPCVMLSGSRLLNPMDIVDKMFSW